MHTDRWEGEDEEEDVKVCVYFKYSLHSFIVFMNYIALIGINLLIVRNSERDHAIIQFPDVCIKNFKNTTDIFMCNVVNHSYGSCFLILIFNAQKSDYCTMR